MKKLILIFFALLLAIPVFADTMPFYMSSIPKGCLGLYQTDSEIDMYSHPDSNSLRLKHLNLTYNPETMPDNTFAVLLNEKKLGFLYVTDIDDEGWVKVVYDKQTGASGWVQTKDRMQFLPWLNFYNIYGRKYGLRLMKDYPTDMKVLRAKSEDDSQSIDKFNYVKQIKVTAIRGNWALVSILDMDKVLKTGFLKWRGSNGEIYAFPDIK